MKAMEDYRDIQMREDLYRLDDIPSAIIKRDGTRMPFDAYKIREAIRKANQTIPYEAFSEEELDQITRDVVSHFDASDTPGVEEIQDVVEETLMLAEKVQTAKAYILYRQERQQLRMSSADLMSLFKDITFASSADVDLKRENANVDGDTAMGMMLKYGSEASKYFVDHFILPQDMAEGHRAGDIHIHDKDFYMLTETCCQIDLIKLFEHGFSTGHGYLREPQSIASYAALACIAIQANQNEMHGGQSVPNFDYAMARGVNKSWRKAWNDSMKTLFAWRLEMEQGMESERALEISDDTYEAFHAAHPSLTLSLDNSLEVIETLTTWLVDEELMDETHAKRFAEAVDRKAYSMCKRESDQAMQALIHNLNTMNSRAGAQVPFSSLNYGTDTSPAGRMAIASLLKATQEGLGSGETAIFPVQIFKVKEGINYNPEDPNYDLFREAMKTSAKRLFPNFSFLDAPFNAQYYREGDYNSEVSYMGCRTRVMANVHDPEREVTSGRGNLSFSSVNLPRLAIEARGDMEKFYDGLDDKIDLIFRQLLQRFNIQARKTVRNYPFLMGQGIWLDSEKLDIDEPIEEVLKHGTLTLGFIGLAETLVALTGEHHGESDAAQKLGLEIVGHMRRRCDEKSEKTGLNFSLIATPAEGLSGRFVRLDRERYGNIPGVTDHEYYSNSFHVPVYHPISVFEKIEREAPYHALTNAGHISYVELDGDTMKNLDAFEAVIRAMKEAGVGYGSVNHPVDRDPICGYLGVIDEVCPRCGRKDGEAISAETMRDLIKRYPDVPEAFQAKI